MPPPISPIPPVPPTPPIPVGRSPEQVRQDQLIQNKQLRKLLEGQQDQMQKLSERPFKRAYYKSLRKGALAHFQYLFWKHDPYPLTLVSSVYHDGKVAGVNLHYLTFRYIKALIQNYCGKSFYYAQIKGNEHIYNSFRTYKRNGLRNLQLMDCNYLLTILQAVRSFNPNEIEAIRKFVQEQLRRRINPTAEELTRASQQYGEIISRQAPSPSYGRQTRGDARFNPQGIVLPE